MRRECEYLDGCPFFKDYIDSDDVLIRSWIKMYCSDHQKSSMCARKIYRQEHQDLPPIDLAPSGKRLGYI